MGARELTDLFASMLELPAGKEEKKAVERHRYTGYLKATRDFIRFHSDLMERHLLNEHFRRMSLEEQDLCRRFHWALGLKAITDFKRLGKRPTKKWVLDMIRRVSPDANDLFGLTRDYFLGFAKAMVDAYVLWFEDFETGED